MRECVNTNKECVNTNNAYGKISLPYNANNAFHEFLISYSCDTNDHLSLNYMNAYEL